MRKSGGDWNAGNVWVFCDMNRTIIYAAAFCCVASCGPPREPNSPTPTMIEATREPTTLLNIEVHVPAHRQESLLASLREMASDREFQIDEVHLPETEGRSLLSGVTRVVLTKGEERIYAINAESREDYTISLSTYRRGDEAAQTLRRLAEELKAHLRKAGLEPGNEEFYPEAR